MNEIIKNACLFILGVFVALTICYRVSTHRIEQYRELYQRARDTNQELVQINLELGDELAKREGYIKRLEDANQELDETAEQLRSTAQRLENAIEQGQRIAREARADIERASGTIERARISTHTLRGILEEIQNVESHFGGH